MTGMGGGFTVVSTDKYNRLRGEKQALAKRVAELERENRELRQDLFLRTAQLKEAIR